MSSVGGIGGPGSIGTGGSGERLAAAAGAGDPGGPAAGAVRSTGVPGRMAVAVDATTPPALSGPAPKTVDELAARLRAAPRPPFSDYQKTAFADIERRLAGRVTTSEVESTLHQLELCQGAEWLTMVEKLAATPSDEPGKSLLEKFIRYGVNDRNRFIAAFADQANRKLGLGLRSLEERQKELEAGGMREGKAERRAGREVRRESDLALEYFKARDKQGFWNGVRAGAEGTVNVLGLIVALPLLLIGMRKREI